MITNLELPKELENQLEYLETISQRPRTFFIQEALKNYLEDLEDLRIALRRLEKDEKTYSSEEVLAKIRSWKKQNV